LRTPELVCGHFDYAEVVGPFPRARHLSSAASLASSSFVNRIAGFGRARLSHRTKASVSLAQRTCNRPLTKRHMPPIHRRTNQGTALSSPQAIGCGAAINCVMGIGNAHFAAGPYDDDETLPWWRKGMVERPDLTRPLATNGCRSRAFGAHLRGPRGNSSAPTGIS
jgi:hypothetical protein